MTSKLIQAAIGLLILALGASAATQYVAFQFNYHPFLGEPWASFGRHAIYAPWSFITWYLAHGEAYPRLFAYTPLFVLPSAILLAGVGFIQSIMKKPELQEFGAEAWATKKDLTAAGLLKSGEPAVVCGIEGGELLRYGGPEHHLIMGATRSGKGRGHVVPTLLEWQGSAFIYDIKGELWSGQASLGFKGTAGWRSSFGYVLRFAPTEADSARFNPLAQVRKGPNEFRDVANIVEIIADPHGDAANKGTEFFDEAGKIFLTGLILHVLYAEPDEHKNLYRVRQLLSDIDSTLAQMLSTRHRVGESGKTEIHPAVAHAANALQDMSERTRSSVMATVQTFLAVFGDELVARNTSSSTFRIGDLMCLDAPVSLYVQPPPSDQDRLRPLTRLLLNQTLRALMEDQDHDERGRRKHWPLLFMLDEFPQLGRLPFWVQSMGAMAGYGLKSYLVCQGFSQIKDTYGPNNSILDNIHVLAGFPSMDSTSADKLSATIGGYTELRETESRSGNRFSAIKTQARIDTREQSRRLVLPDEIRATDPDTQYLVVGQMKPYRGPKVKYDKLKRFQKRNLAAPVGSHVLDASGGDWIGVRPASFGPPPGSIDTEAGGTKEAEIEVETDEPPAEDPGPDSSADMDDEAAAAREALDDENKPKETLRRQAESKQKEKAAEKNDRAAEPEHEADI